MEKIKKRSVGKLILSMLCIMLILGMTVPTFAGELPETGLGANQKLEDKEGKSIGSIDILGTESNIVWIESLTSNQNSYWAYCLNNKLDSPKYGSYEKISSSELINPYDENVLKIFASYPIINNKKVFPITNNEYFTNNYTKEELDYYIRQVLIWTYENDFFDNTGFSILDGTYSGEKAAFAEEIKSFYNKVIAGEIQLPTQTEYKIIVCQPVDGLTFNESTGYYETGAYTVEGLGILSEDITIKSSNLPSNMEIINSKNDSILNENDTVEQFYLRISKDDFDALEVKNDKVAIEAKISFTTSYTTTDYNLYKNTDINSTAQDMLAISTEKNPIEEEITIQETVAIPKSTTPQENNEPSTPDDEPTTPDDEPSTPDDEPSTPLDSSKTGDESNAGIWLAVMAVSALGAGIVIKKKGMI